MMRQYFSCKYLRLEAPETVFFFSPSFLFPFTSYYRLIHNPHHLKTFLSVKLRDRAGRFFYFLGGNISLLLLISPQHDVTLSHLLKILHRQLLSDIPFHFGRAEVGLISLCNRKFSTSCTRFPFIQHHVKLNVMFGAHSKTETLIMCWYESFFSCFFFFFSFMNELK